MEKTEQSLVEMNGAAQTAESAENSAEGCS